MFILNRILERPLEWVLISADRCWPLLNIADHAYFLWLFSGSFNDFRWLWLFQHKWECYYLIWSIMLFFASYFSKRKIQEELYPEFNRLFIFLDIKQIWNIDKLLIEPFLNWIGTDMNGISMVIMVHFCRFTRLCKSIGRHYWCLYDFEIRFI